MLAESVGRSIEVVGELADGAEVGLLGVFAESGQLKVLKHPLAECRGHRKVLSQRGKETPLRKICVTAQGLARDRQIGDRASDEDWARSQDSRRSPGSGAQGQPR